MSFRLTIAAIATIAIVVIAIVVIATRKSKAIKRIRHFECQNLNTKDFNLCMETMCVLALVRLHVGRHILSLVKSTTIVVYASTHQATRRPSHKKTMVNWTVIVGPAKTGKSTYASMLCKGQVFDDVTSSVLAKLSEGHGFAHYLENNNFEEECVLITCLPRVAQEVVATLLKVAKARPRVFVFASPQCVRFAPGGLCGVTIDKVLVCAGQEQNEQEKQNLLWHEVGVDEYAFV